MTRRGRWIAPGLDELEGADKARWEASFDEDRFGQETSWQRLYRENAVMRLFMMKRGSGVGGGSTEMA